MPIDPSKALGAELGSGSYEWDRDQVILYHLGLGAGVPATDPGELACPPRTRVNSSTATRRT